MKLLFVHSTKIKEDTEGNYYTGGSYNKEVWDRYLSITNDLTIIARKDPKLYDKEVAEKHFNSFDKRKIKFIEVPNLKASYKAYFDIRGHLKRKQEIKKAVLRSDYLIARLPSNIGNIAIKFARKLNKPYLTEVVGCPWDTLWNYNFKGKLLAPINYLKQKRTVKKAPYVIYVTSEFLQNRYPTNGDSVNCSNVSLINFNDAILERRFERIANISDDSKIIIGTTAPVDVKYKGQQSVIKALGKLKKKGVTNFEYQLIGGGDHSTLKKLAEDYGVIDQIKFLGTMPHKDVFNWLDSIDIYAQPSKTEGLPRALIEAMSRGILSIGTNVGGIPELLEDKYLFSKAANNHEEIVRILKGIRREDLLEQAKRNYKTSKEYDRNLIESRRQSFFKKFISHN